MNIPYIHRMDLHNDEVASKLSSILYALFEPKSVIDIGCGTGNFLSLFKKYGVKRVLGLDGSWANDLQNRDLLDKDEFFAVDLNTPPILHEKFSLAMCLEVVEHLKESAAIPIVDLLVNSSDNIVFSAAIPSQPGQNHINLAWPEKWANLFRERGFLVSDELREQIWDDDQIPWWYRQNIFVAYRASSPLSTKLRATSHLRPLVHPKHLEMHVQLLQQLESGNSTFAHYFRLLARKIRNSLFRRR
jgi:SAM-dependent methyltransferase